MAAKLLLQDAVCILVIWTCYYLGWASREIAVVATLLLLALTLGAVWSKRRQISGERESEDG